MIPRLKPYLTARDWPSLFFQDDGLTAVFEDRFAQLTGARYALWLPYGRSALYFFLKGYGLAQQEIIVPAYTCQSVIGPIKETNNIPVFIDSSPDDFNLDEHLLSGAVTDRTKAVIVAAMYGTPIDLDFYRTMKNRGIRLIGDYALGLLTFLTKQKDALDVFDLAFFSFGLGKEVSFLGGGALITNNEEIYRRIKELRDQSCRPAPINRQVKGLLKFWGAYLLFRPEFYHLLYLLSEKSTWLDREKGLTMGVAHNLPEDFFYSPHPWQAKLALDRLTRMDQFITDKKESLDYYYRRLAELADLKPGLISWPKYGDSYSHLPVLVPPSTRDSLLRFFIQHGIHSTVIFKKTLDKYYTGHLTFPQAQRYADGMAVLPLYYGISPKVIDKVINTLQNWMSSGH
ncbi:MAG: DegT/DnrJ/EryC1/StrS family aminotransferase [Deltaproteobacteria bacterium]|nr:DegT/DnrJ/EryC1/StrS family aminotransferase [Deltaproteobacteria bacterium]